MGISYKGNKGQTKRAVALQEEEKKTRLNFLNHFSAYCIWVKTVH